MELIDFNDCQLNDRTYGGLSGQKLGIVYKNDNYILKFPKNLKEKHFKNVNLSYSNAPISEYIGSHIYQILGIPVHETMLGFRNKKIVVACKDFLKNGDHLNEFREIKTTYENAREGTDGNGAKIDDILSVIRQHPMLNNSFIHGAEDYFWDMFVVDAFIGNLDRNNGNWGVIRRLNGVLELAPVYDNGGCLNNKFDDAKLLFLLNNKSELERQAYTAIQCFFTRENEHKYNPFQLMDKMDYEGCTEAIKRIVPKIDENMNRIFTMIDDCSVLTETQNKYFKSLLSVRLEKGLLPTLENIIEQEEEKCL